MRRVVTVMLLMITSIGLYGQQDIRFSTLIYDFGAIAEEGGVVSHTFSYTNQSSEPFVITDIVTSCGCTKPEFSTKPLLSGQSGELVISFDPMDRPGRNAKQIRIHSNQGQIVLRIVADVTPRHRTLEELFPFSIIGGGRLAELSRTNVQVPKRGMKEVVISVANSNFTLPILVTVDGQIGESVEIPARESRDVVVEVRGDDYGKFQRVVGLRVNGAIVAESIMISGVVVDDFSVLADDELLPWAEFSTHYVRMGRVAIGDSVAQQVVISNNGNAPLLIRWHSPSTATIGVHLPTMTIEPQSSTVLTLTYSPLQGGYDSRRVKFILNDPRAPLKEVRVVAEVPF